MTADIANDLERTLDDVRPRLIAIGEVGAARISGPEKWSRKEILGHLIDSAANNHQRFVRLQIEDLLEFPGYQQNDWVSRQKYDARKWIELVELWSVYNRHLAHV